MRLWIIPLQWRGHVEARKPAGKHRKRLGLFLSNGEVTLKPRQQIHERRVAIGLFLSNGEVTLKHAEFAAELLEA